jgi:1-phosphatidylinositol-3-phosphate 5-kinase
MRVCKTCIGVAKDYNDSSDDDTSLLEESFVERQHSHDNDTHTIRENSPTTPVDDASKLSLAAPTPPPRMAITATRNGESVEIPVSKSLNSRLSSIHTANFRQKNRNMVHKQHDDNSNKTVRMSSSYNNNGGSEASFLDYINTHNNSSAFSFNNDSNQIEENTLEEQSIQEQKYHSSDSEDEGSMSIYAALHLDKSVDMDNRPKNRIFVKSKGSRTNTRSLDRAQASLLRIRNRKKSKSISKSQPPSNFRLSDLNGSLINYSSPNLSSPITFDETGGDTQTSFSLVNDHQDDVSSGTALPQVKYTSELNDVCLEHFKNLLHQSLSDEDVTDDIEGWERVLTPLLQEVEKIEYNVKAGENMDIRQYVKLKRLPGGSKEDTQMINGVVFSKTFALKSMPKDIENPRIALIMFPLEYMRTGQHYMSLEPVLAQEDEYIHKLVARIIALNADVVFVGASVSGLALRLLDDAGIAVAYNMKPQVIEKIARLTQADIVVSMDKLAVSLKLGECKSLSVKTYAWGNVTKTIIYLTGCDQRLGSTLLIRGGDEHLLRKVKEAVELMVYIIYNLKLETAFYRDNFMYLSQDFYQKMIKHNYDEDDSRFGSEFLKVFNKKILSSSPTVQFETPKQLVRIRNIEQGLFELTEEYKELSGEIDLNKLEISNEVLAELKIDPSKFPISKTEYLTILKCLYEKKIQLQQDTLNIKKRQWKLFALSAPNLLDPQRHQRIAFLYSMVSIKSATPCIGPHPLQIDYYWDNDMTLGQYVEHLISSAHNNCSEGCGESIAGHYRSYVHGNAKVDVMVEKFYSRTPTLQNVILTWSYCKQCGYTTPYLPMSSTTYKYSFGKFLELLFWSVKNSSTNLGHCIHDFAKDHIKYFSLNDLTLRMEYSKVDILELLVPRIQLAWKPHTNIRLKIENNANVIQKCQKFFNSILSRLNRVKVDSISNDKMEAGQKRIKELIDKVNQEQSEVNRMIEELYNSTDASDQLAMNSILRVVQDLSVEWDSEFAIFEYDYLPSEKDIARITTHQLRRFFLDDNEVKQQSQNEPIATSDVEKVLMKPTITELLPEPLGNKIAEVPEPLGNKIAEEPEPKQSGLVQTEPFDIKGSPSRNVSSSSALSDMKTSPRGKVLEEVSKFEKLLSSHEEQPPQQTVIKSNESFQSEQAKTPTTSKTVLANKADSYFPDFDTINNPKALKPQFGISAKYLEQKLKEGRQKSFSSSASPITNPKIDTSKDDSKVMKLTSYFDQIHFETLSKEFEMQRERERLKLIQNRYKAAPVSSSKPIVEVYKNVKDAVNEDDIGINDVYDSDSLESIKDEKPRVSKAVDIPSKDADIPQTERVSLMKTLANFWADRSATLWKPLEYPLGSSEHIFVDSDVIVREDEPSSLVSFCLSSSDYVQKISVIRDDKSQDLESVMLKKTAVHLKYQFNEGSTILSCKIFFAEQFDAFRRKCGIDENFVQSLSRCVKWDSAGGKSGSAFLKTLDDRLVIKELSNVELESFVKFAPSYFEYMAQALFHDLPTVIAKIFGFYQIHVKNPIDGTNLKMDILIMENLFYDRKNLRIFDLKGSMRNRHVEQTGKENEVLLDENMVEYIYESPLFVREYDKKLLKASLWNDTLFLAKMNVMDYSLVIGIDDESKLLTVGIIDCIRTFTWDKKLESWVKEKGFVGGGTKEPTVVTPRQYKNRFREAMDRYILMVPDEWFQGNGPYGLSQI